MNSPATLTPRQLRKAADIQERILTLQDEMQALLGAFAEPRTIATEEPPKKKRKKFSAAAKAKMQKAQKARWAKIRAQKRGRDTA